MSPQPAAEHATTPVRRVWLTSTIVAVVCMVGTAVLPRAGLSSTDVVMGGAIALLVAITERWSLSMRIGHETQRLTLSEIPLILGIFLAAPLALVGGRLLGTVLALQFLRRQDGHKTAYNVSYIWAETLIILAVVLPLGPPSLDDGGRTTLVVVLTAVVVAATGALGMTGVLSVMEGRLVRGVAAPAVVHGLGPAIATSAAAAIILALAVHQPFLLWAPTVIVCVLLLAYRSHTGLLGARDMQADLIQITHDITGAGSVTDTTAELIAATKAMMDAATASIRIPIDDGDGRQGSWVSVDDDEARLLDDAVRRAEAGDTAPSGPSSTIIVAPIDLIPGGWIGVALDPTHGVRQLDRQALEMLANHAGVALANARRGSALQRQADDAQHRSRHDPLTGLPNRAALLDMLTKVTGDPGPATVLLIDLDNFKEINDALGHAAGDAVLRELSARLQPFADEDTTLCRLGGDEFAVIAPGGRSAGLDLAGRLTDAIRQTVMIGPYNLQVGASIGVALYPDHGTDGDQLLKHADLAMYEAKHGGGGSAVFGAAAGGRAMRQLAISMGFREALRAGMVTVAYQPIIDLRTRRTIGVEALSRWQHPTMGPIRPDEFVRVAEQAGLITDLTQHVLTESLTWQRAWARSGYDLQASVNLSVRSLLDDDLVPMIVRTLDATGVDASRLTLELTEGSILSDPQHALAILHRLSRLGVTLSIDDFGTGYSSLAYLRQIPAAEVKIDKSFILPLREDDGGVPLVSGVIRLCREMGFTVVGEGIETHPVQLLLQQLGCDAGQGFGIGRPMPGGDVLAWLQRNRPAGTGLRLISD